MNTRRISRAARLAEARTCAADGCTTRLSIYNAQSYCYVHRSLASEPARRPRMLVAVSFTGNCAYEPCGAPFETTNLARKYCSDRCRMLAFQARSVRARMREGQAA